MLLVQPTPSSATGEAVNTDRIEALRNEVREAIGRIVRDYRVRAEVEFRVPGRDRDGGDDEEHMLVLSKKQGLMWIRVDDEHPAETVSVRMLVAIPAALELLVAECEKVSARAEGEVDRAIDVAKRVGRR